MTLERITELRTSEGWDDLTLAETSELLELAEWAVVQIQSELRAEGVTPDVRRNPVTHIGNIC